MSSFRLCKLRTQNWLGLSACKTVQTSTVMTQRATRALGQVFVICILALIWADNAAAESRVALVIGNGGYQSVSALDNPTNDARDITNALEALNFNVFAGIDTTRTEMDALVRDFGNAAQDADVSLVYYAGHAFQINDQNFLLPVDAAMSSATDIANQTMSLDDILEPLSRAKGISLIFLDACRDNPFGQSGNEAMERTGLARIGSDADFMFAFATQPYNTAADGLGRNSPFTKALLSHIHTAGIDISELMISVRKDVMAATGGLQIPWDNSSLTRKFQFIPGPESASPETMLWQVAAQAQDPLLMELYVDRYPQGPHVGDAMAFLDTSNVGTANTTQAERNLGSLTATPESEDQIWEIARRTRMRPLVIFYQRNYPAGKYAAEADQLMAALDADPEDTPGRQCEILATHPRDATANTSGVPFARLQNNAVIAETACRTASEAFPNRPHYTALLARVLAAQGKNKEAIHLYERAAEQGDLRAMVSLGLLKESGGDIPKDVMGAMALYERAAEIGSADAAINLAVALFSGGAIDRDVPRAVELLQKAAAIGSPIATYNLGVLSQDGVTGEVADALGYFEQAARNGEPRGYLAAAILLDEGRGVDRDPEAAAVMLLRGAAADGGEVMAQLTTAAGDWSRETIAAMQTRLAKVNLYGGAIDGISGKNFSKALNDWRNGGFDKAVLDLG